MRRSGERIGAAFAALGAAIVFSGVAASAETLPPGGKVNKAVTANLTPHGIDFLLDEGLALLPDRITVPDVSGSQSCLFDTVDYNVYQGDPSNGVKVTINNATLTPLDGYFSLSIGGSVAGTGTDVDGGGTTRTFAVTRVEYEGCLTSCSGNKWAVLRLLPTPFAVSTTLDLQLMTDPATGEPYVEAVTTLDRDDISLSLDGIDAAGCAAIDVLVAVLKNFLVDAVKDEIIKQVNETLLPAIEEGFQSLRFDDVVDLAGAGISVKLLPSALDIRPGGVTLSMSSRMEAVTPTTCVPIPAGAGSAFTPGEPPLYSAFSPGGQSYDVAASVSDDFVSQALFATWHAGLLCQDLSEMGLSIDMLALAGLAGPLNRLGVPEGAPMVVLVKGYEPPAAAFGNDPLVGVHVRRLEISILTVVHDRMARIIALELEADAGVNVLIDAANVLSFALDIAPEDVHGAVAYDEMISGGDAQALLGLLPTLLEQFLPQLTGNLPTIDLGAMAGIGLQHPEFVAEQGAGGVPNDTLSAYTGLVSAGGCAASGGGAGCGVGSTGGCALGGRGPAPRGGIALLALAPLAVIWRRRRVGR